MKAAKVCLKAIAVAFSLAAFLYVLSFGMAYRRFQTSSDEREFIFFYRYYGPMMDGARAVGLQGVVDFYLDFWSPDIPRPTEPEVL